MLYKRWHEPSMRRGVVMSGCRRDGGGASAERKYVRGRGKSHTSQKTSNKLAALHRVRAGYNSGTMWHREAVRLTKRVKNTYYIAPNWLADWFSAWPGSSRCKLILALTNHTTRHSATSRILWILRSQTKISEFLQILKDGTNFIFILRITFYQNRSSIIYIYSTLFTKHNGST